MISQIPPKTKNEFVKVLLVTSEFPQWRYFVLEEQIERKKVFSERKVVSVGNLQTSVTAFHHFAKVSN